MLKNILSLLAFFVCLSFTAAGQQVWAVKLQKDYSKSYPLGNETVALLNRYGQMTIETWDKNEVKVEAKISASAQTNESATKMLERISINDQKTTDRIEFRTELAGWSDDTGGHELHIDWTVHVPANAKLQAENHFGGLTIGDYRGEASLFCKYGTLTTGKLNNCREMVSEFGKAIIESVNDSKLLFRYSKVDISHLSGNIQAEMQFCNSVDLQLDNTLKQFDLKNNYTSVFFLVPKDFSADYDITTNNAKVSSKNDVPIKEEIKEDVNAVRHVSFVSNHHYIGSLGKGVGTKLMIKSNFGNIRFL